MSLDANRLRAARQKIAEGLAELQVCFREAQEDESLDRQAERFLRDQERACRELLQSYKPSSVVAAPNEYLKAYQSLMAQVDTLLALTDRVHTLKQDLIPPEVLSFCERVVRDRAFMSRLERLR